MLVICVILSSLRWAHLAREVRGKTLSIAQLDYVAAAEAVGAGRWRIVVHHILPNVMSHVVVATTLLIPSIILIESFLSFLGLGVQPPMISWGLLLNAAQNIQNLGSYPWVLAPVIGVLVAVMSFNMLGDGLRDAIDPVSALRRSEMDATQQNHLVEVRNLSVRFKLDDAVVDAVENVSFHVDRGQTLALVGESGAGKSVTARAIIKLLPRTATVSPDSRVMLNGTRIDQFSERQMLAVRGNRISMIFQEPMSSLNPIYRIGNQIAEGIILHQGLTKKQARTQALDLLKEVRIPDPEARLEQYPHQLSGGQRQRVMIAIAIANSPELLIADEPTTALDVTVQAEILKLIRQLQRAHDMAVILVTHNLTIVEKVSDSVAVMRLGRVLETNTTRALFAAPQNAYTKKLLTSQPSGRPNPVAPNSEVVLETDRLRVEYNLQLGQDVQPADAAAGRRRRCHAVAEERRDARHRRRVRLRQDHARQGHPEAAAQ